jgi:hypothetical protein
VNPSLFRTLWALLEKPAIRKTLGVTGDNANPLAAEVLRARDIAMRIVTIGDDLSEKVLLPLAEEVRHLMAAEHDLKTSRPPRTLQRCTMFSPGRIWKPLGYVSNPNSPHSSQLRSNSPRRQRPDPFAALLLNTVWSKSGAMNTCRLGIPPPCPRRTTSWPCAQKASSQGNRG